MSAVRAREVDRGQSPMRFIGGERREAGEVEFASIIALAIAFRVEFWAPTGRRGPVEGGRAAPFVMRGSSAASSRPPQMALASRRD